MIPLEKRFTGLLIALGLISGVVHAASEIDTAKLSESQVEILDLSKPGAAGKTYLAGTIIATPMPKLCALIQRYVDYPSFMPNTDKALIVASEAGATLVDMKLKLPLGKSKQYRLRMTPQTSAKSCRLGWKLVPRPDLSQDETIADTTGYWLLEPSEADAGKTVVRYHVYSDPGPVPMGLGWIVDALGKDSLPKTLESLRAKAQAR